MAKVDKKFLKKILETPSVTGTEVGVAERGAQAARERGGLYRNQCDGFGPCYAEGQR